MSRPLKIAYLTAGAAGMIANDTRLRVAAFPGPNCEGAPTAPEQKSAFESVVFSA